MIENVKTKNGFTMPTESGMDETVKTLAVKWGGDSIRDSDGTELSPELIKLGFDVLSTLALVRADQDWAKNHPEHCQQKFLMSDPLLARSDSLTVDLLNGYSREEYQIDEKHDPAKYWQVFDRTSGNEHSTVDWDYCDGRVNIKKTQPYHQYTVNFLVYQVWETTSMYNHITNGWTGEHQMGMDPRQPETRQHMLDFMDEWLKKKPKVNIVRFTSMFYQFPIINDENNNARYKDWCGYQDCTSALALDEFEKEYGYRLTSEDLVREGTYNSTKTVPRKPYLDWIEFTNKFVRKLTGELVVKVHNAGKKAMLFFCDHWIGTDPYADGFSDMGFDAVVGPCINGRELRRIADVPGDHISELRLYPYFFPVNLRNEPSFQEGGDPVKECRDYWINIRRTMLRKPVERIGFGGYLSLAVKFPEFIDYVEHLADEFREIRDNSGLKEPYAVPKKICILTAWGKTRPWMYDQVWPAGGFIEALSAMPFRIEFISFDDIAEKGIDEDTGVIISFGDANTSWSGGECWKNEVAVSRLREWIHQGGGYLGGLEPSACWHQGKYFQLKDVLGIEREIGLTLDVKCNVKANKNAKHFILADCKEPVDLGNSVRGLYACSDTAEVLATGPDGINLAVNSFGKGRSVYYGGYTYNPVNARLLLRSLLWVSGQEADIKKWQTVDCRCECAYYPNTGKYVVINNSADKIKTVVFDGNGKENAIELGAFQSIWSDIYYANM